MLLKVIDSIQAKIGNFPSDFKRYFKHVSILRNRRQNE